MTPKYPKKAYVSIYSGRCYDSPTDFEKDKDEKDFNKSDKQSKVKWKHKNDKTINLAFRKHCGKKYSKVNEWGIIGWGMKG